MATINKSNIKIFSYIGRNPTKGIESVHLVWALNHEGINYVLHWKKSHKGNWEFSFESMVVVGKNIGCYIGRNPTKGIEREILWVASFFPEFSYVTLEEIPQRELRVYSPPDPSAVALATSRCYIGRNPTKGIESYHQRYQWAKQPDYRVTLEEIPQRELRALQLPHMALLRIFGAGLHWKKSHKGNWE